MNRSESKFKNTANKMAGALVTLLESKEFADISIMDICNKAGVHFFVLILCYFAFCKFAL